MLVAISAADFVRYLTWGVFSFVGIWTALQAVRRPTTVSIDTALFFGGTMLVIVGSVLLQLGAPPGAGALQLLIGTLMIALPLLLVRLLSNIIGVARVALWGASGGFVLCIVLYGLTGAAPPVPVALLIVGVLVATLGYGVLTGLRAVRHAIGITRRRLIAITLGSSFLVVNISAGSLPTMLPIGTDDARSLVDLAGLAAGVCYWLGFAPPQWLRRAWQWPEVRAFLEQATRLSLLPDTANVIRQIEQGAAAALGVPNVVFRPWDESAHTLALPDQSAPAPLSLASSLSPSAPLSLTSPLPDLHAFQTQRTVLVPDRRATSPPGAAPSSATTPRAVLAAPVTLGMQRMGVLVAYAPRAPIFAEDDLALIQLLADQTATLLESRRLSAAAVELRAREAAAHSKEDFLSMAAHDLKTPLTVMLLQAQKLARRAAQNPDAPADQRGLERMIREGERMRSMVSQLLDATRAEYGQIIGPLSPFDIAGAVREIIDRYSKGRHPISLSAPPSLVGSFDGQRVTQVIENLIDNAVKYSPAGGPISVKLLQGNAEVQLSVADQGIGIPADDLPQLFARFHRGANVDDRRFPGWGLGLSVCRQIVEQHGGQISVESQLGVGSTFHLILPLNMVEEPSDGDHPGY